MKKTRISDRYELNLDDEQHLLGRGGEGRVFVGKDIALDAEVAVKVVDITNQVNSYDKRRNKIRLLQEEFSNFQYFDHTNIISYYDWGVFSRRKRIFFATIMDLADSGSLAKWRFEQTSNLGEVHLLFTGILEGLKYIHDKGIIHRDLKPSNILLKKGEGKSFTPLITDLLSDINDHTYGNDIVTAKFGDTLGTIEYMAPELLGTKDIFVGTMTDMWSFGVMVYEFFTGELPFGSREQGDSMIDIAENILSQEIDSSKIPSPYDKIVSVCLNKDLASRVSRAEILIELLKSKKSTKTTSSGKEIDGFKKIVVPQDKNRLPRVTTSLLPDMQKLAPAYLDENVTIRLDLPPRIALDTSKAIQDSLTLSSPPPLPPTSPPKALRLKNDTTPIDQSGYVPPRSIPISESHSSDLFDDLDNKHQPSILQQLQELKEQIELLKREQIANEPKPLSRQKLFDLIADDNLQECFRRLNSERQTFERDIFKTFIGLKGEWSQLKTLEILGTLEFSSLMTSTRKIRHKLMSFIELIEVG